MNLPAACPEIPVQNLAPALAYYRDRLGFTIDWQNEQLGLAGLSQGDARLFLANPAYRAASASNGPITIWLNLNGRAEIDLLHARWHAAGARITSQPEAKPYKLYEFFAEDLDQNCFRVFYDFGWEEKHG